MIWSVPCGDYTIYAIEDGHALRNPLEHFTQSSEDDWEAHELESDGRLRLRYGCFLLAAADHRILVDAGMGPHRTGDFVAGQTPAALETLGVDRDTIETVIHTHMHFDHIGGTMSPERDLMYPTLATSITPPSGSTGRRMRARAAKRRAGSSSRSSTRVLSTSSTRAR